MTTVPHWLQWAFGRQLWWLTDLRIEMGLPSHPFFRVSGFYLGHVMQSEDVNPRGIVRDLRRWRAQIDAEAVAAFNA